MSETTTFDILVLGGGPGGYTAAIKASQCGFSVAIIEKRNAMGGTCLNMGCIPSKALLDSSEHYHTAKNELQSHGIIINGISLDIPLLMAHKKGVIDTLTKGVAYLLKQNKVTIFNGIGSFASDKQLSVLHAGVTTVLTATKAIIIATGSATISLPQLPFNNQTIVEASAVLSFSAVPPTLAIVGGGAIGLELASVWSRLGSLVTIIEKTSQVMPGWDTAVSKALQKSLVKQGITIFLNTTVSTYTPQGAGLLLTLTGPTGNSELFADKTLIAVGRHAFTDKLNVSAAGIIPDPKTGVIPVDKNFKTTNNFIYAIGDVIGAPMLAHKASAEGIAAINVIAGKPHEVNYKALPAVLYTNPEAAMVGETEESLLFQNKKFKTGITSFKANGKSVVTNTTDGFIKMYSDSVSGRLLGVHIVGPHASDLIATAVSVLELGGSAEDISLFSYAHPTYAESLRDAARDSEKAA
jgi:dihydrolipoamide dehydrogenase